MKLLSEDQVPDGDVRLVFRDRSWPGLLVAWLVFFVIAVFLVYIKWGAPEMVLAVFFPGGACVLLGVLLVKRLRRCLRPENWLLKVTGDGLYIKLHSPLTPGLPSVEGTVVFLPAEQIGAVCLTQETRKYPKRRGYTERFYNYVDVFPKEGVEVGPLVHALRAVRRRAGSPTFFGQFHFPVRVLEGPTIRLLWDWVHPPEKDAVVLLGEMWPMAPVREVVWPTWDKLDDDEKEALIGQMWEEGYLPEARRMLHLHRRLDGKKAARYFEEHFKPL